MPPGNDFKLPKPQRFAYTETIDTPLSMTAEVYFWKEIPNMDYRRVEVPVEVMKKWMIKVEMNLIIQIMKVVIKIKRLHRKKRHFFVFAVHIRTLVT